VLPFFQETGENPTMKNIVVTGGAGFIGNHLVEALLAGGHSVICLDNFFTGTRDNVARFRDNARFELIRHDVVVPVLLEADEIYHLACPASPVHYQNNPIKTLKTSVLGTLNLLGMAKRLRARILLSSTSEVYGDPLVHPQPESYWGNVNPIGPRSCYDESKRFAEALTMAYQRAYKIDTRIARIFNTYGPRMRLNDGRVVPNFIYQLLNHKPLTVYGKGSQTRSFCYIDDLIEGIFRLMKSTYSLPVNLGNPREFTILELAHLISKLSGSKTKVIFKTLPQDDPRQRKPDISLANKVLKWKPHLPIEEGLERTIKWFRLSKRD